MASGSAVPARTPALALTKLRDEKVKFTLSGTDISVANALRRVMMAEVPTFAIHTVYIKENGSVLHDEFIAHRLGLMPLRWKPQDQLPQDAYLFKADCECPAMEDGVCHQCTIELVLDVTAPGGPDDDPTKVTSRDLQFVSPLAAERFEVAHYVSREEEEACTPAGGDAGGIVLAKLAPGQRLAVRAVAQMGIGKMHAKWNPTATVAMRYEPEITLNADLLERVSTKHKKEFVKLCQPGVFAYDATTDSVVVKDASRANNLDEIRKVGAAIAKPYSTSENIVAVGFVPEKYNFTVETSGALAPEQIVASALSRLVQKMGMLQLEARAALASAPSMAFAGAGAAAGGAGSGR